MRVTIYSLDEMEKATQMRGDQLQNFLKKNGIESHFKDTNKEKVPFFEKPQITKARILTRDYRTKVALDDANKKGLFTLSQLYSPICEYFDVPFHFFKRCVYTKHVEADSILEDGHRSNLYARSKIKNMLMAVAEGLAHRRNAPIVEINATQFAYLKDYIYSKEEFALMFGVEPEKVNKKWDKLKVKPMFVYKKKKYYNYNGLMRIKKQYFDSYSEKLSNLLCK